MELHTKKLGDNSIELEEHNNSEYPLFHEFPLSLKTKILNFLFQSRPNQVFWM